ncbi:MAG: NADPH-dependent assimilatory sulfite reductase hemoprotein subunit [Verrucomicrobiota bacterium]
MAGNESIKTASNYLRGTLIESLANGITGSVTKDDTQLTKFHGIYQQDDRDIRAERRKKKLEPAYSFMIRVRVPGGVSTPQQWLEMDRIAHEHANGTIKLTTRQAFQFHGVIKSNLKRTIREINDSLLDTIAACGDVNRNVMCNPNPFQSRVHAGAQKLAQQISDHLTPRTSAYHEIWLTDDEGEKHKVTKEPDVEPIYGPTYLPRKFKVVVAVPPSNDVDIFANCLGYIAIVEDDEIIGWNVTVGGGMGMTHGDTQTFPRLADILGFCTPEQAVEVAEAVVRVQKEYGNRLNRKNARLKYTIENFGIEWFRNAVEQRIGYPLQPARPYKFEHNGDRFGWSQDHLGNWHYGLFVENGRLYDTEENPALTGLREIAKVHEGDFRLSANQNLVLSRIRPEKKDEIQALLDEYGLDGGQHRTALRRNSMACVALPTCGLSLAESERYLPKLISDLDDVVEEAGLRDDDIVIRMTGCPNGCGRPYLGEIGFVGTGPNTYNLYLGAGFAGERLSKLYQRDVKDREIVSTLRPILLDYAQNRQAGEHFGDFTIRAGYVHATTAGNNFHENIIEREAVLA